VKRREFGTLVAAGVAGSLAKPGRNAHARSGKKLQPRKNLKMAVGNEQNFGVNELHLTFLERFGVKHKAASPTYLPGKGWDINELLKMKEQCAKHDLSLDVLRLPWQRMNVDGGEIPHYMLGNYDKGDREIDLICEMIRTTSKAGIRCLVISLKEMENQRTEPTIGRGGNRYSAWDLEKAKSLPPRFDKPVSAEQNWERVTHFLKRVIPVATEYKVQIANHPCDPWLPPGFRGVDRVLGGFDGFKRYIEISPSPYHGLDLCLGCMAESCDNPASEVYDIVQYFGERQKIFQFHFRNITGKRNNFVEVYPDEGVLNMHRVMQILRDVQYPYMIDPDHYPGHSDDKGSYQSAAYQFGYIQAMIQAVNDEV
jgi:mannonate dehydratase